MRFAILAFCGVLLLGSAGAFLLYVSVLSILAVVVILMAVMLMFQLGVQVERQRRVAEIPSESTMPQMQESRTPLDAQVSSFTQT
jgi:uncharacterized membrane protein